MKRIPPGVIKLALIAVVIGPLCVSLIWRQVVGPCDYIAQGGLLLLMFVLPFCTSLESSLKRHFGGVYVIGVVWGFWRMFYFDSITQNDISGVGYLIGPAMMGGISTFIFLLRKRLARRASAGTV